MTTNKKAIFEAARYFVNSFGIEPREGFIANELSAKVSALVEVSIEGRSKGTGIAIVRFKGEIVAHEFTGTFIEGEWIDLLMAQYEVSKRLDKQVVGIPMWEALNQNAATVKQFLYVEQTDGGMNERVVTNADGLRSLYGWMHPSCAADDAVLVHWMGIAEVGDYAEHRLGVCVRLKDAQ